MHAEAMGSAFRDRVEPVARFAMEKDLADAIHGSSAELAATLNDPLDEEGLREIALAAHELPRRLREELLKFRIGGEPDGGLVLSGMQVADDLLGPTPSNFESWSPTGEARRAAIAMFLVASLLGDPFSHSTIQDGKLVMDLFPMPTHEEVQLGSGSSAELTWHVEEAFHDHRADWLLLMCMRNPQQVATTFSRVDDVDLSPAEKELLFRKQYPLTEYCADPERTEARATREIAVLSGDPSSPFVRLDPLFMDRDLPDPAAGKALTTVIDGLNANLQDVILQPGDVFIVDNLRAVHGRRSFSARYDGTDRWIRGVFVTSDLRKSAAGRSRNRILRPMHRRGDHFDSDLSG